MNFRLLHTLQAPLAAITAGWNRRNSSSRTRLLGAVVPLYWLGRTLHRMVYLLGLRRRIELPGVTIGVGNLTVGGTGKTPVTIEVAESLRRAGRRVAVLTRGYGSVGGGVRVVSDGQALLADARTAGEEAMLLAGRLPGIPVVRGKHRNRSGWLAHRLFGTDTFVLDDSFQYDRVVKHREILLFDLSAPLFNEALLPLGRLREPLWCARRADAAILTRGAQIDPKLRGRLRNRLQRLMAGKPLFESRLEIVDILKLPDLEPVDSEVLRGMKVCCCMAVGSPLSFVKTIRSLNTADTIPLPFPDHHRYTCQDFERVDSLARDNACEAVLLTEKDYCSAPAMLAEVSRRPKPPKTPLAWYVVRVKMTVQPEQRWQAFLHAASGAVATKTGRTG